MKPETPKNADNFGNKATPGQTGNKPYQPGHGTMQQPGAKNQPGQTNPQQKQGGWQQGGTKGGDDRTDSRR